MHLTRTVRKSYSPLQVTTVRTRASSCNVPCILSEATVWIGWSAAGCGFQWLRGERITAVIAASRLQLLANLARKKRTKSLRVWEVTLSRRFCTGRRSSVSYWDWSIRWLAPRFGSYVRRAQRSLREQAISLSTPTTRTLAHARAILLSLSVGCSCWVGQTKDQKIISPDKSTISQTNTFGQKKSCLLSGCAQRRPETLEWLYFPACQICPTSGHSEVTHVHQVPSAYHCKPKSDAEIFTLFCWFWLAGFMWSIQYNTICFLLTFRPPIHTLPHTHTPHH